MNKILLSENALKEAAAAVRRSMLDSLPPPSQCERAFSDIFQARMKRLVAKAKLRRGIRRSFQRAAVFFLAVLVGTGIWLTVDVEARAQFFAWVREIYEDTIVYRFYGEPAAEGLPAYRITWLPEGYEELEVYDGDEAYNAFYQQGEDVMSGFVFEYSFVQEGAYTALFIDEANYAFKAVDVNGIQADFYQSLNPDETNNLIWIDENTGIVFTINGYFEESVMLHIAKSVKLSDITK